MSSYYHVLVEMELADDVSEVDLATLRWLIGLELDPPLTASPHAASLYRLLWPRDLVDEGYRRQSGGPTAQLRRGDAGTSNGQLLWSLALRTCELDDRWHENGLAVIDWLGTLCRNDGFFASAREDADFFPTWIFASFQRHTYMLSRRRWHGLTAQTPPAPEWAQAVLVHARFDPLSSAD